MSILAKGMEKCLHDRLDEMKHLPLSEIIKLPPYSDETIEISNKVCTLAVWKNQRIDGIIEVILQIYYTGLLYRLFGAGTMIADGFVIDIKGEYHKLPDEIRWRYC